MSLITEEPLLLERLSVFPLAEIVLFPGIVLPLQVEEPQTCAMLDEAMAGERILAMTLIQPGHEGEPTPPLCEVGGVGRIIHCEKVSDNGLNVLVQGLDRVLLLEELPTNHGYRQFKAKIIPQPNTQEILKAQNELVKLQSCINNLVTTLGKRDEQLVEVIRSTNDPLRLADILAATVVPDLGQQQKLLATVDLKKRLAMLVDALAEVLARSNTKAKATTLN